LKAVAFRDGISFDKVQKHSSDETASPQRWPSYLPILAAVLAVLTATLLIVTTYPVFSQTCDEGAHLAAGMEWLDRGSYSYDLVNPPLPRVAIALGPYLAGTRSQGVASVWNEGNALLEYQGHYERTLTLARLGILPFFWLACFVLWHFSSRTYGQWHAALAVLLFAFCPPILVHASLAATDMAVTAMFILALVCFWKFLQEPKPSSAAFAGVTMALAILSKLSAVPYLGISCTALYVYALIEKRHIPSWKHIAIGGAAVALTIWAGYRFSVGPIVREGYISPLEMAHLRRLPDSVAKAFFFRGILAPEFFKGLSQLFGLTEGRKIGYLFGETYRGGRWYFFPVAIAVKTPIPLLLLAAIGVVRALIRPRPRNAVLPLVGIAGPLSVAMLGPANMGLRYVLVIYPFLAILSAYALLWLWQVGGSREKMFAYRSVAVVLVVWNIVTCVRATPDFIPYFNELAAPYGSRILVDSDFDWGQDLKRLSSILQQQQIDSIWISYAGSADLKQHGLPYWQPLLPNEKPSGWIAISESNIKTLPRDFGWLEKCKPERIVGKTIRLYHFDIAPAD
jgi:Dolichyl-phosphate-mannose-protein mannosyltransferase